MYFCGVHNKKLYSVIFTIIHLTTIPMSVRLHHSRLYTFVDSNYISVGIKMVDIFEVIDKEGNNADDSKD